MSTANRGPWVGSDTAFTLKELIPPWDKCLQMGLSEDTDRQGCRLPETQEGGKEAEVAWRAQAWGGFV
jgi:hypothetical protein